MFCSLFDTNLTPISWTKKRDVSRDKKKYFFRLTFMKAQPQGWLKLLNDCNDIDLSMSE